MHLINPGSYISATLLLYTLYKNYDIFYWPMKAERLSTFYFTLTVCFLHSSFLPPHAYIL